MHFCDAPSNGLTADEVKHLLCKTFCNNHANPGDFVECRVCHILSKT